MKSLYTLIRRIRRKWDEGISDAETHYKLFLEFMSLIRQAGYPAIRGLWVLDIGCGDRAGLALLLALGGAHVVAVDVRPVYLGWHRRPWMWARLILEGSLREAVLQVARDGLHTWRYWRHLGRLVGARLPFESVRVQRMDAQRLSFADESFDIVVSSAVWEHLEDVGAATRHVNRVLRPRGVAIIQIALFPSLQGGHHADWHSLEPDPDRQVRPWDHLRSGARPLPLYCNRWREEQYRQIFEAEMAVERWVDGPLAGYEYLTGELRNELVEYSERDLLLLWTTVVARKRVVERLWSAPVGS